MNWPATVLLLAYCSSAVAQKPKGLDTSIPLQVKPIDIGYVGAEQRRKERLEADQIQIDNDLKALELRKRLGPRPFVGASIEDTSEKLRKQLHIPAPGGARITGVARNSPASGAGLKRDDVVVAFNGTPIRGASHYRDLVRATPIGAAVQMEIYRKSGPLKVEVLVSESSF